MNEKIKDFLKNLFELMKKPEMLTLPSTLAYYFVLSVVPIISILLLIAGSFNLSVSYITEFIEENFSPELMKMITPIFSENTFSLGFIVYILMAFFLASNGSNSIIVASNMVFNIENKQFIKRRVKAFVLTFIIFLLFTFILVVPVFGEQILSVATAIGFKNNIIEAIKILYPVLNLPITLLVTFYFIKLIYIIAPDEKIKSKYVTKGTIFTTVCWFVVTLGYSYYIKNLAHYNVYYAGLSTIVVLMVWFYILAFIFVIGLGLNYRSIEEQIEKTNSIKLKELEEKVKASKEHK